MAKKFSFKEALGKQRTHRWAAGHRLNLRQWIESRAVKILLAAMAAIVFQSVCPSESLAQEEVPQPLGIDAVPDQPVRIHPGEASSADGTEPPGFPREGVIVPNVKHDPTSDLKMGAMQIVLEKTKLRSVQIAIGAGQLFQTGDAADSITWLCYTVSTTKPAQRVWMTSSEIAGGIVIDGIVAARLPSSAKSTPNCPELPEKFKPLGFSNGVWLGTTSTEIHAAIGQPKKNRNVWTYSYEGTRDTWHIYGSVVVRIVGEKTDAIWVNHSTQN